MKLVEFWERRLEREKDSTAWTTQQKLRSHLNKVKKYDAEVELDGVDLDWLEGLEAFMRRSGNSQNTIATTMSSVKSTLQQAVDRDIIVKNPFAKYKIRKGRTFERALLIEDVKAIEGKVGTSVYVDAWLFSFYCAGIRIGDICRLNKDDVSGSYIEYKMHKNGKRVSMPMNAKAKAIAERYLSKHPESNRLFGLIGDDLSKEGEGRAIKLVTTHGNNHFKEVAKELNLSHMSWHAARAAFATYMVRRGTDLDTVRQLLKHSSIITTQEYLASRNDDQLGDIVDDAMDF